MESDGNAVPCIRLDLFVTPIGDLDRRSPSRRSPDPAFALLRLYSLANRDPQG